MVFQMLCFIVSSADEFIKLPFTWVWAGVVNHTSERLEFDSVVPVCCFMSFNEVKVLLSSYEGVSLRTGKAEVSEGIEEIGASSILSRADIAPKRQNIVAPNPVRKIPLTLLTKSIR